MNDEATLQDIGRTQDSRLRACLAGRQRTRLWFASYPTDEAYADQLLRLHALGFDNYLLERLAYEHRVFFLERLLGCRMSIVDGREGSFAHTWCVPIVHESADIDGLRVDLGTSPVWRRYTDDVARADRTLPVEGLGLCPLDTACSLCGAERLFTWMIDAPAEVERLFDLIGELFIECRRRVSALDMRQVEGHGLPCVYFSDLQMAHLSPAHIERFVLPTYEKVAREFGGALFALQTSDIGLLERVMAGDWVVGCAFDKRLALGDIRRAIGDKLFVINNYAYDDALDRPTSRDGLVWNPIVQTHSRDLEEAFRELSRTCSMVIGIERPSLDEVCRARQALIGGG